jgi:hypothetical protein
VSELGRPDESPQIRANWVSIPQAESTLPCCCELRGLVSRFCSEPIKSGFLATRLWWPMPALAKRYRGLPKATAPHRHPSQKLPRGVNSKSGRAATGIPGTSRARYQKLAAAKPKLKAASPIGMVKSAHHRRFDCTQPKEIFTLRYCRRCRQAVAIVGLACVVCGETPPVALDQLHVHNEPKTAPLVQYLTIEPSYTAVPGGFSLLQWEDIPGKALRWRPLPPSEDST